MIKTERFIAASKAEELPLIGNFCAYTHNGSTCYKYVGQTGDFLSPNGKQTLHFEYGKYYFVYFETGKDGRLYVNSDTDCYNSHQHFSENLNEHGASLECDLSYLGK